MSPSRVAFMLVLAAAGLALIACETGSSSAPGSADVPSDTGGDTAGDADTPDVAAGEVADTAGDSVDADAGPTFACGAGLRCAEDQACKSTGQGACMGPPPDPQGRCAPNCYPTECGGGTYCLCDWFECVALPAGCSDCDCARTSEYQYCICDDASGSVFLSCPGA